ncbi:nad-dependent epimerase dehydratase : Nucleoside-diphosphate-sugar epimerase OS=Singulisphaera acidiphila (strain ATCC BAA-1392 / DSM 18658 / VKM B-2454 / MOB10) GN=Sinac_0970 PE=4 SV=1: Epimerase [Gemmataceae bacterium]|nr:nad-dependent epimerase dehydratase : Nucleoside-diphosphate-sugar epimerase OS=Singulisphaera acidiphila (strain ATCC BAA-1392 / DSM 18658 / VKM B-2454 / MOB10) GN=Sinac_0970 PE=4 SV=1: Epimerase [Gemmataceae bacterium]VTU01158.1 nad-dependent epimerase dehydratase : Nucleoside-diphosphate-sugar epimerase OS=Singulisphaera acidiphila (strain ATCC BAA-1392 / DSM 18658 / VKM B-2454 / MOB10) GN=Sinac_0970 PE=4 SV=1: Epimerase [Gemmataceae bacterium]
MRVLITGGYGFIGAWIARNLLARGDQVWVFDLREDARRLRLVLPESEVQKVTFVPGDVTDLAALKKAIADFNITHVIHLAGLQVPTCRADPMLGAKVNVLGTLAVFEAVKAAGDQVKRLVYASSAAVFGGPDKYPAGALGDDVLLTPSTHYGIFKCCNEGNARIYFQDNGISSVGLRPWTVYGVGRDLGMTSEPTKAIKAVLLGRPYHINFGGWTDFQYVDDVAKTFVHSLERPYTGAKSYNLRGAVVTVADFVKALCEVLPDAAKLVTVGTTQIAIAYDLSDAGIERDLGPMPKTPLAAGIRETVEIFGQLHAEGRLDTSDLDAPKAAPVTVADEP